jgi:hypothetical protein
VGQAGAEVREALRAEQQLTYDQQGPALADQVQGVGESTRISV